MDATAKEADAEYTGEGHLKKAQGRLRLAKAILYAQLKLL